MVARDSCGELYSGEAAWLARVLVFLSVLYMVYVHLVPEAQLRAERVFLACSTEDALSSYFCTKAVCALHGTGARWFTASCREGK